MIAKKKVSKKVSKTKPKAKSKASPKTKVKGGKRRKDKFSFNYEDMKNSTEWKSDWDDDAGDFEGESTEY